MAIEVISHINDLFNSVSYHINDSIIDPGDEWEAFYAVDRVFLTHAHFDHIYGINRIIEINPNVQVYTNEYGKKMLLDSRKNLSIYHESPFVISDANRIVIVDHGYEIEIGNGLEAHAVFTPGHNPSCITWVVQDNIFTGDAYIPGIKTVTNLPGGNKDDADRSIQTIRKLAIGRQIFSGHSI